MDDKNILILDNDGTLSKFKNGNFSDTIGEDLKNNIKKYVTEVLSLNEKEYIDIVKDIKNKNYQLSEGFEKLGIIREEYFFETWKNLDPKKYIIDRGNKLLRNLIEKQEFRNIMITGAPDIWFQNSIKFLGYDLNIFDKIYTANDFYSKREVNLDIFSKENSDIIKNSMSIGDEQNDFMHLDEIGGIGININNSLIYK